MLSQVIPAVLFLQKLLKWYDRDISLGEVGFIPTDVDLVIDEGLREHVKQFARDEELFFSAFAVAYQKLVDAGAVTEQIY